MISFYSSAPSPVVQHTPSRTYNFNIKALAPDDPHRAEGYTHSAYPITVQASVTPSDALSQIIAAYDTSDHVNSFILNGKSVWIDKATRVGLMNSISIERAAGRTTTTLWFGGYAYSVSCDLAIQLLSSIELYALQCYTVTAEHQHTVSLLGEALSSAQDHYAALLNPPEAPVPDGSPSGQDGSASAPPASPTPDALHSARAAQQSALDALMRFDFTAGYPDKLIINV